MTISPEDIKRARQEEISPLLDIIANILYEESDGESTVKIDIDTLRGKLWEDNLDPDEEPYRIRHLRPLERKVFFAIKRTFENAGWRIKYIFECERDEDGNIVTDYDGDACGVEFHAILFKPE